MSKIKNCNDSNFKNEVLDAKLPVLVDFWAEWCGPCKMLTPILEELSDELEEKISIVKVNLDENQDLAMNYSIRSIPTLLLFKDSNLIDTKVGSSSKDDLKQWVSSKI
ncbi:MAG: thioredoxin [Pelagibacteraceae bacterium TMED65]|nr:thioredoxin [Rickettsiales bacterium]OUU50340.1 MAG: thioredoxin [Pelagibacteraceae bacterium TMED65]